MPWAWLIAARAAGRFSPGLGGAVGPQFWRYCIFCAVSGRVAGRRGSGVSLTAAATAASMAEAPIARSFCARHLCGWLAQMCFGGIPGRRAEVHAWPWCWWLG